MREPITEAINLKCSSCDSPLIVDDASREPAAIICCQGCGKEFGTVHEIADTAAILLRPLLRIDEFILTRLIETCIDISMDEYKRNQVEEAISRINGEKSTQPSQALRTQLKRLLDTDRGATQEARAAGSETVNYAFYSTDSPGKGTEVFFSAYEAFALDTGVRLLNHAWPQGFVVRALRHVRADFEKHHSRILRQDPAVLFDAEAIKAKARPGDLGVDNTDPVFLTIATGKASFADGTDNMTHLKVCRGMEEVSKFVKQNEAHSWSLFELASRAHQLRRELSHALPRSRGRG
jgi:hypothetical protein